MSPCFHGGVCEAVEWIYQCNCADTDHYGPMCETGTKYSNRVLPYLRLGKFFEFSKILNHYTDFVVDLTQAVGLQV